MKEVRLYLGPNPYFSTRRWQILRGVLVAAFVLLMVRCGGSAGPGPGPGMTENPSGSKDMGGMSQPVVDCCLHGEYHSCSSSNASSCLRGFTSACTRDATQDLAKCGKKTGDSCTKNEECADKICIMRGGSALGICTQQCSSFTDCPSPMFNWECDYADNVSMKVCIPK